MRRKSSLREGGAELSAPPPPPPPMTIPPSLCSLEGGGMEGSLTGDRESFGCSAPCPPLDPSVPLLPYGAHNPIMTLLSFAGGWQEEEWRGSG